MNISQIGGKLREQIRRFSGKLSTGLPKATRRFVFEAIYGIASSGYVRLSEIARALDERTTLHKTIDRLSRQLARGGLSSHILEVIIEEAASRIGDDTLIIVDISDIRKKYAKKMEYLARVHDGSTGEICDGYWTCDAIAVEAGESEITPLYHELYSQKAPDFESENSQILKCITAISDKVNKRGVYVLDRGGDRNNIIIPLIERELRFLIRLVGNRHLIYRGKKILAEKLADSCTAYCSDVVIKEKENEEKVYHIELGFRPVKLPGRDEKLYMVVVKGFGKTPLMLLTNHPIKRGCKVLRWVLEAYITRWKVEETIRFIKQSYNLEDIRVMTYQRLKNVATLVLATAYFTAVYIGARAKLEILAGYAMTAAKRIFGIPDFKYYALADGMLSILKRYIMKNRNAPDFQSTVPLFDTS